MDYLVCAECRTTYYSEAARMMVERAERCDCGGRLDLRETASQLVAVGAAAQGRANGTPRDGRRRFSR